ncbi:MAG: prephenate dehydrogenase/arogenate dehydrogenase family protein, partial [Delftia sp.]|nr:prephenate dehydrogenase/arogenate dehydrogenase family protein [Delftia sp.]
MNKPCITIIGLGLIGGSIGLALQASGKAIHVVGHDIAPGVSRLAQKKGVVNKSNLNLPSACENADLLIIATPITASRETLADIKPHLKPGCVITDTAVLKGPVLAWAEEILPG